MYNVLIVDDCSAVLEVVKEFLQQYCPFNYNLFVAKCGLDAVQILKDHKINICISDFHMSEGDGIFVLQYIKRQQLKLEFILCSSVDLKFELLDRLGDFEQDIYFNIVKPELDVGFKLLRARLIQDGFYDYSLLSC